jgi:hypothetical protein
MLGFDQNFMEWYSCSRKRRSLPKIEKRFYKKTGRNRRIVY